MTQALPKPCRVGHWPYEPETCTHCMGKVPYTQLKRYARGTSPKRVSLAVLACRHRGEPTGETADRANCHKDPPTQVRLVSCAVHGVCTVTEFAIRRTSEKTDWITCCKTCGEREAPAQN